MDVVNYKKNPKHTYSRSIYGTRNKQWICATDLQNVLQIKRINVRGKQTIKLKVNGRKALNFLHKTHLEDILARKPTGNQTATWLRALFLGISPPHHRHHHRHHYRHH